MNRRDFIALLGGAVAWPLAVRAQQPLRLGVLVNTGTTNPAHLALFIEGLRKLGWIDGQNLQVNIRWYEVDPMRARALAAGLSASAPDVTLTGGTDTLQPMQEATRTIPIVFVQVTDPV